MRVWAPVVAQTVLGTGDQLASGVSAVAAAVACRPSPAELAPTGPTRCGAERFWTKQ